MTQIKQPATNDKPKRAGRITAKPLAVGETMNPQGRPKTIPTPEEFDARVNDYIAKCRKNDEPILLLGMCLHLGLYGKEALAEYATYDGFSLPVKRARSIIEHEYEKRLNTNNAAAGPIFALKNFGWRDQQHIESINDTKVEMSGSMEIIPGLASRLDVFDK